MREQSAESFPLYWPDGWPRIKGHRDRAAYKVGFQQARVELERGLDIMRARYVVLSTNVPLRLDGLPYAGSAEKHYQDPGVAVYFSWKDEPWVIACDCWDRVKDNVRAIGLTVDAMRQIERSGATELLKRAFSGFKALPAQGETGDHRMWWDVIGCQPKDPIDVIKARYRLRAAEVHPDRCGGETAAMVELNNAMEQAEQNR